MSKKTVLFAILSLSGITAFSVSSEEAICHRCEEIREYNAEHHQNFEYYDEYLRAPGRNESAINREPTISQPIPIPSGAPKPKDSIAERNTHRPPSDKNATQSTDSSGVKTIPSPSTSLPSTSVSTPNTPPANQAPQNGTVPYNAGQKTSIPR